MKAISLVIPFYNEENYIKQCLQSIISQTFFPEIEIICINDGSTDNSVKIVKKYEKEYGNIKIIDQTNKGVAVARNIGILNATGDYLAFIDPDDFYLNTDTLETLYSNAVQKDVYICGGSLATYDMKTGKISQKNIEPINNGLIFNKKEILDYTNYQFDYGFYRFIYKRDLIKRNNIFFPDYRRFQDPPFFIKSMVKAKKFLALPEISYCYRVGQKKTNWEGKFICDLVKGLTEDLEISSKFRLKYLHALTLQRFKYDFRNIIMRGLKDGIPELPNLLSNAEKKVNVKLLRKDEDCTSIWLALTQETNIREIKKEIKNIILSKIKKQKIYYVFTKKSKNYKM